MRSISSVSFIAVKGNCDSFCGCSMGDDPAERVLEIEGHRILLTHGHLHGVKASLIPLASSAQAAGCDIALFGHTHIYTERYQAINGSAVCLFNPGSIGMGDHSYGVLHINGSNVLFSQGRA